MESLFKTLKLSVNSRPIHCFAMCVIKQLKALSLLMPMTIWSIMWSWRMA